MRNRRRVSLLFAIGACVALALAVHGLSAQTKIQKLPVGAGAIGKGPDAIVLPGYEDVPRPPAFTDATRKLAREQEQAIDNYTPQPAFAGQTRAPKPSKVIPYSVEVFGDPISNPWSIAFLPDGRLLVTEMNKGLRLLDKNGKSLWYINGLPLDFSKRGQQMLDIVPDKDFARTRTLFFLYRVPPKEAGDIGKNEEDFPIHYPQIEMVGRGQLSADDKSLTDVKVLLNTHGIEPRLFEAPGGAPGPRAAALPMDSRWGRHWVRRWAEHFSGADRRRHTTSADSLHGRLHHRRHSLSMKITIYQKPTCTTCRQVHAALTESGVDFDAVNYYLDPIPKKKLLDLLRKMGITPRERLRTKEPVYKTLRLAERELSDAEIVDLMVKNPDLIQRPIVEKDARAILARPADRLKEIL